MRVEFYTEESGKDLQRDLNAVLENHDDEDIEIQYQYCATYTGYRLVETYSAMVIFKGRVTV